MTPTKKHRITVVTPYFFPKIGGLENYAYHTARHLSATGDFEVSVITTNHETKSYREEIIDGMRVYRLPIAVMISNTPLHPLWYFMMRRIFKKEGTELIHAHAPVPMFADIARFAGGKIPFVLTYHSGSMKKGSFLVDLLISVYERVFLAFLFSRVTKVIPVSQSFFATPLGQKYGEGAELIRPGIDTTYFTRTPIPDTGRPVVLFVGRIEETSRWKGIDVLLEAFPGVLKSVPAAELVLVGAGDAVPAYQSSATRLGIADHVDFRGALRGDDLRLAYRTARVVVLPSTSEAEQSSVVLIEAMASGRPVIGTNIGGTPHIIRDNKNGVLVAPKNARALSDAITTLLRDHALAERFGKEGREDACLVDWSVQGEKYRALFQSLLSP